MINPTKLLAPALAVGLVFGASACDGKPESPIENQRHIVVDSNPKGFTEFPDGIAPIELDSQAIRAGLPPIVQDRLGAVVRLSVYVENGNDGYSQDGSAIRYSSGPNEVDYATTTTTLFKPAANQGAFAATCGTIHATSFLPGGVRDVASVNQVGTWPSGDGRLAFISGPAGQGPTAELAEQTTQPAPGQVLWFASRYTKTSTDQPADADVPLGVFSATYAGPAGAEYGPGAEYFVIGRVGKAALGKDADVLHMVAEPGAVGFTGNGTVTAAGIDFINADAGVLEENVHAPITSGGNRLPRNMVLPVLVAAPLSVEQLLGLRTAAKLPAAC